MNKGAQQGEFPQDGFYTVAEGAISEFSQLDHVGSSASEATTIPSYLRLDTLQSLGVPIVDNETFAAALAEYLPLRARLCKLCECDGWSAKGS